MYLYIALEIDSCNLALAALHSSISNDKVPCRITCFQITHSLAIQLRLDLLSEERRFQRELEQPRHVGGHMGNATSAETIKRFL